MAWLGTWAKRRKITIDSSKVGSDETHFPIPILINSSAGQDNDDLTDIFDEVGSDWQKIAVTKSDGTTQLYVEKELWDTTGETAVLWVSKSDWTISSSSNTEIYIYYDSSKSDNTDYVAASGSRTEVWNSDFEAVYPMSSNADDSTDNNNYGLVNGASLTTGKLGKCYDFDGSNDYIKRNVSDFRGSDQKGTICAWVKIDNTNDHMTVFSTSDESTDKTFFSFRVREGYINYYFQTDSESIIINESGTTLLTTGWHFISIVSNGDAFTGYVDAVVDSGLAEANGEWFTNFSGRDNILIGAIERTDRRLFLKGLIDNVMILSKALSSDEIALHYNSQNDNLLSFSTTEIPPGIISGNVTLNGNAVEGATVIAINTTDDTVDSSDTTDSNGDYELEGLITDSKYHIVVEYESEGTKYNAASKWDITPVES